MPVRLTPSARRQLLDVITYIRDDSPSAAAATLDRVGAALLRLGDFPESGHAIPEFPELPHREVLVEPYRLFYRVVGDTVWVVGVWHGRQLPGEPQ